VWKLAVGVTSQLASCVGMSWLCDPLTAACEQSEGQLAWVPARGNTTWHAGLLTMRQM